MTSRPNEWSFWTVRTQKPPFQWSVALVGIQVGVLSLNPMFDCVGVCVLVLRDRLDVAELAGVLQQQLHEASQVVSVDAFEASLVVGLEEDLGEQPGFFLYRLDYLSLPELGSDEREGVLYRVALEETLHVEVDVLAGLALGDHLAGVPRRVVR